MATKIPAAWLNRGRLRLSLPDGLRAVHDAKGVIPPERYVIDAEAGHIALLAEPEGEVMLELAEAAPARVAMPPRPADAG